MVAPSPIAETRSVPGTKASEAEIVRRAKRGDEQAFVEIIQRHQNMVYRLAYRMVRRPMDAEDIAQQVFAKIFYALKKFNSRSSLSTWIYRIALNETYDYLRKLKTRKVVYQGDMSEKLADSAEPPQLWDGRPARVASRAEQRDYLMKLLQHVSEQERLLLFQKEVEGLTISELSELTGINPNTIKVKLFRARKKLVKAARTMDEERPRPPERPGLRIRD